MSKLKKTLLIFISTIVITAVVVILFISPITKYLVQKYDEKYTGRKITMDWAYVNPFTGYIHFNDFKIYELKSDSVFFSANGLNVNFAMLKMLSKTYEITELSLDHPRGIIIQSKKDFNFNDLIEKFSSKDTSDTLKAPVHFNIVSLKINDGEFHYHEKLIPISYFIKKVNIESTGKRWDADTTAAQFSFLPGTGTGDVKGNFTINLKNLDYRYAIVVHKFDLNIIEQYLKDLTNYGSFSAILDANINAGGNFNDEENTTIKGLLIINDFHFGKNPKDDYASFDKLVLAIKEISPKNYKYLYDSISLSHPYFKYERYDYLDNLQTIFGVNGDNITAAKADAAKFNLVIEIANHIKVMSRNFFRSDYKINRLAIYNGDLKFNDYSISEKFSMALNPFYVIADSIDKNNQRVEVSLNSGIKPYGEATVRLSINPKDSGEFDMQYRFQKLPVSMFNPYIISYTSFPLDRGTLEFNGTWNVRNGIIQSDNHLVIVDPRVTKKIKNKDTERAPMPLIMSFIRARGNVIDYEIPITGNLKSPQFNLHDILIDLVENIFVKPATTPYRAQVKNIETEIEKSLTFKWQMRQSLVPDNQEKFIERMAEFLTENPDASITVHPQQYAIKEKEYILFFEAKKKYFLLANNMNKESFSEEDSEKVAKMSVKDSMFIHYLNKQVNDSLLFTIQDKCTRLIDSDIINSKFKQLNTERKNAFISYFKEKGVENRINISTGENVIPYNGFSFYKIEYKGEFPEPLIKAYHEMNELNDEAPRNKFKKERKENLSAL
ncbi:MAG: DUF748 domain-containing protein [Bacteroidia bacterium]